MNLDYLSAYIDINEIDVGADFLDAGKRILDHPGYSIKNFSRNGYILEAFRDLVNEEIDLEEFMKVGDISSERRIYTPKILREVESYIEAKNEIDGGWDSKYIILVDRDVVISSDIKKENYFNV